MSSDYQEHDRQMSVPEMLSYSRRWFGYLKRKRNIIFIAALAGALAGLLYSIFKKPVYTASCTFVVDEGNKQGAFGELAGLASLTGLGQGSAGGVFQEDNILELYKSRSMIEKSLLSSANIDGKDQLLIDRYISFNQLREKWKKKEIDYNVSFAGDPGKFNRLQDSIITNISNDFNKKSLDVSKPDKKTGIIKVNFASTDEIFAKEFTNTLVKNVNKFYLETITKKSSQNVSILQHQADSVKNVLNYSIGGVASSIDASPNANPLLQSLRVPSQRKEVDVQASSAVYAEIIKNLELAKITLRQETPLIQVIDTPILPLMKNHTGKILGILAGVVLLSAFAVIYLTIKRVIASN